MKNLGKELNKAKKEAKRNRKTKAINENCSKREKFRKGKRKN